MRCGLSCAKRQSVDSLRQALAARKSSENATMKLATYFDGSRDGQLVVVSRDLSQAHFVSHLVNRLQSVLDDWNYLAPQLQDLSDALNAGRARHPFPFDPARCMAPLPRASQWVQGFGHASHLAVLRQAAERWEAGAPEFAGAPVSRNVAVLKQGSGANFGGPQEAMVAVVAQQPDFAAQVAVITSDLATGASADRAIESVRLLMLANAVQLRALEGPQARPLTAFSPVAVTPDELGEAWHHGRVHLPLLCHWNGRKVGMCDAGADMTLHFGQLISQLVATRGLTAGSVIGGGPVSSPGVEKRGHRQWPGGYSSIVEKRAMETLQDGQPVTGYLQDGDTLRIEMKNAAGQSIFGAIEQALCAPDRPANRAPVAVQTS